MPEAVNPPPKPQNPVVMDDAPTIAGGSNSGGLSFNLDDDFENSLGLGLETTPPPTTTDDPFAIPAPPQTPDDPFAPKDLGSPNDLAIDLDIPSSLDLSASEQISPPPPSLDHNDLGLDIPQALPPSLDDPFGAQEETEANGPPAMLDVDLDDPFANAESPPIPETTTTPTPPPQSSSMMDELLADSEMPSFSGGLSLDGQVIEEQNSPPAIEQEATVAAPAMPDFGIDEPQVGTLTQNIEQNEHGDFRATNDFEDVEHESKNARSKQFRFMASQAVALTLLVSLLLLGITTTLFKSNIQQIFQPKIDLSPELIDFDGHYLENTQWYFYPNPHGDDFLIFEGLLGSESASLEEDLQLEAKFGHGPHAPRSPKIPVSLSISPALAHNTPNIKEFESYRSEWEKSLKPKQRLSQTKVVHLIVYGAKESDIRETLPTIKLSRFKSSIDAVEEKPVPQVESPQNPKKKRRKKKRRRRREDPT